MRLKQYPFVWGAGVKTPCQDVNLANFFVRFLPRTKNVCYKFTILQCTSSAYFEDNSEGVK